MLTVPRIPAIGHERYVSSQSGLLTDLDRKITPVNKSVEEYLARQQSQSSIASENSTTGRDNYSVHMASTSQSSVHEDSLR
jgi:hypothetical protein